MDDRRFDTLARTVAGSGSRRGILRGLAGAAALLVTGARAAAVAAQRPRLGPGDPCRHDDQCFAADAPLVCADNGFDWDGPLNCCTFEGSRCGFDQACCGDASCVNGFCSFVASRFPGPGERCNEFSVCAAADTALTCDYVNSTGDLRCCAYAGSPCGSDAACCGDASCFNGYCAWTSQFPGPGDPCNAFSNCLAADTAVTCDFVNATGDYRCCAYEGSRCGTDAGCCGATSCVNGFCASAPTLAGPGDPCQNSAQCVAADTAVTCDYVGWTDDFRCCAYEGSRCGWDGGCCGWLRCGSDGFCTSQPPTGCNVEGCDCDFHDPNACAPGLVCCAVQSGFICATWANCGG